MKSYRDQKFHRSDQQQLASDMGVLESTDMSADTSGRRFEVLHAVT